MMPQIDSIPTHIRHALHAQMCNEYHGRACLVRVHMLPNQSTNVRTTPQAQIGIELVAAMITQGITLTYQQR